jgi:hypothetical protein
MIALYPEMDVTVSSLSLYVKLNKLKKKERTNKFVGD